MADKATLEQQSLPYQRKIEKQAKVLEGLSETEKIASKRLVSVNYTLMTQKLLIQNAERLRESLCEA